MSLLSRLRGPRSDDHASVRPLWHAVVASARARRWYADLGVADTLAGRFDMVTLVLALVMIRMESEPELAPRCSLLAELFVTDMDGQLRESGVGDLVVGKHIGRLMSVLGGRIGAYREALAANGDDTLAAALGRNLTLKAGTPAPALTGAVRAYRAALGDIPAGDLLRGSIPA